MNDALLNVLDAARWVAGTSAQPPGDNATGRYYVPAMEALEDALAAYDRAAAREGANPASEGSADRSDDLDEDVSCNLWPSEP